MNVWLGIAWWMPMWIAMGVGGYYLGRNCDNWSGKKITAFCVSLGVLYVLWPIIGALIFTYG